MFDKAFFLVCMVITFYVTIKALQKFSYSDDTLTNIVTQFKTGYVQDIVAVPKSTKCPLGYSSLLNNYQWPGSFQGCGCASKTGYTFYINDCPDDSSCITVSQTDPEDLHNWGDITLCYLHSDLSYVNFMEKGNIVNETTTCNNSTHRICGLIDNLNNSLCLEKTIQCPITYFSITQNEEEVEKYKKVDPTLTITNLNGVYVIVGHKERNDTKILTNFRIDATTPCLNSDRSPSSELLFELMKNKYDLTCEKYENGTEIVDELYLKLNTISYAEFLKSNEVYETITNLLDKFSISISNLTISMYAKTYPSWSFLCMKEDADTFFNFIKSNDVLNRLSFLTILHSFIIIIILIGIGVCAFYFIEHFEKLFYLIILGFIVLNLLYPIQVITNANWVINNLSEENGVYCGDESLNILLFDISDACLSLMYSYVGVLCISCICLIIYIFMLRAIVKPTIQEIQERLLQLREM